LDVSPAEETVSKDYDKSMEEASSSRRTENPSIFVKSHNHEAEAQGDMNDSNTSREKYESLRNGKEMVPDYIKP
jgi:hypothetical protein